MKIYCLSLWHYGDSQCRPNRPLVGAGVIQVGGGDHRCIWGRITLRIAYKKEKCFRNLDVCIRRIYRAFQVTRKYN